jgi:hypothetical protein
MALRWNDATARPHELDECPELLDIVEVDTHVAPEEQTTALGDTPPAAPIVCVARTARAATRLA